jgi:hypothetical protein
MDRVSQPNRTNDPVLVSVARPYPQLCQGHTHSLSLYVLAATGFGRSFDFQSAKDNAVEKDMASSYRDVLSTVLDNVILLILVPYRYSLFCQSRVETVIEQAAASRSTWSAS